MRDEGFVAVHRGGKLTSENHRKLMSWARFCFQQVLPYYGKELDKPLKNAIRVAEDWQSGKCSTGDAITASREVHALARALDDPVAYAVARAVGQGVATAHMADHCIGSALYAQKAVKLAGESVEQVRNWQIERLEMLPGDLVDLIIKTMDMKAKGLGV